MRHVLILCTGNSARSILGEVLLNHHGRGEIVGYSAGSQPKGQPNPLALETLRQHGHLVDGLRSKSWDEFTQADAPELSLVITVCDSAAAESCPVFPGRAPKVHWSFPDPPAAGDESAQRALFSRVYAALSAQIQSLCQLPRESWENPQSLREAAAAIHTPLH